jgi:hypothetical protein
VAFAVHQHEARRVPQLVAEVAIAFAAREVEVDVAAERRHRRHREAQRVGAERGNAVREFLARLLLDGGGLLRVHQARRALRDQRFEVDAVDDVDRVERVALALRHLLAFGVAHEAVHVHRMERHLAGEVRGHHDHAGDPEEDDVEAGDQHRRRQEVLQLRRLVRPAERRERHERRREPRVEHVLVALERAG